jgi:hypothetical protein
MCHVSKAPDPSPSPRKTLALSCVQRLRTLHRYLGGVRRCHTSFNTGPCLAVKEGSDADTRPSALDRTHLEGGLRCCHVSHGSLHRPWAVEINEDITATICSKAHVFSRHARALPRCLQDVRAIGVIITYKPCGQTLQHHATVLPRATDPSQSWRYSTTPCS